MGSFKESYQDEQVRKMKNSTSRRTRPEDPQKTRMPEADRHQAGLSRPA